MTQEKRTTDCGSCISGVVYITLFVDDHRVVVDEKLPIYRVILTPDPIAVRSYPFSKCVSCSRDPLLSQPKQLAGCAIAQNTKGRCVNIPNWNCYPITAEKFDTIG